MIFHSLDFLVFFLVVVSIYWRLPHRGQNILLLGASYIFYGWVHPWFVILMLASTTVDYWAGQRMEDDPARKKTYLYASLAVNLGMLGVFKYYNFFIENVRELLAGFGLTVSPPILELVLPAGISFYTFQALSYTVEVYWGHMRARRNAVDFALFVAFFPHLVAGPIMRATNLLVQVEQPRTWNVDRARNALVLIAWGFFKKLVVADNVGIIANRVFSHEDPSFEMLWAGVFAFGLQIYADFSAYSDIARGTARWLGFELVLNFNHPYISHSPTDFWRRWHISLSSWFRDFVYIPLGGNRGRRPAAGGQPDGHVPGFGPLARRQLELRALGPLSWDTGGCHAEHREAAEAAREMARSAGHRPDSPDRIGGVRGLVVLQGNQPGLPAPVAACSLRPRAR